MRGVSDLCVAVHAQQAPESQSESEAVVRVVPATLAELDAFPAGLDGVYERDFVRVFPGADKWAEALPLLERLRLSRARSRSLSLSLPRSRSRARARSRPRPRR